jgi:hypothetical protein
MVFFDKTMPYRAATSSPSKDRAHSCPYRPTCSGAAVLIVRLRRYRWALPRVFCTSGRCPLFRALSAVFPPERHADTHRCTGRHRRPPRPAPVSGPCHHGRDRAEPDRLLRRRGKTPRTINCNYHADSGSIGHESVTLDNRTGESLPTVMLFHAGVNNTTSVLWLPKFSGLDVHREVQQALMITAAVVSAVLIAATRERLGYRVDVQQGVREERMVRCGAAPRSGVRRRTPRLPGTRAVRRR